MARTNMTATRVKPDEHQLVTLHVIRAARISPNFVRVTLGGGDVERFRPMGFDQWFRLFIPVSESSLARLPQKLDTLSYVRYLTIAKTERPVLRNYTVRAVRGQGADAEIDVDFVVHGSEADGTAGPAATWALTCKPGDPVAILDEGIAFNPPTPELRRNVWLVADETGVPAVAGILESLPRDAQGRATLEVPRTDDRQSIDAPPGIEITWIPRADAHAVPGVAALRAAERAPLPDTPFYGWVAGEQALATGLRRHWVRSGVPKANISFCGYWRTSAS